MAAKTRPEGLRLRKHADKSTGTRIPKYDPNTGEKRLVNPDTPGDAHEPWPLLGVSIANGDGPPKRITLTPSKIAEGVAEGWITVEGGTPVVRAAGPTPDVWASSHTGQPHTFIHYDSITLRTLDGDFAYKVVHQPDKYVASANPKDKVTRAAYESGNTRVDNFYVLELEG